MGLFDAFDGEVSNHGGQHTGNERRHHDRAWQAGRLFPCEYLHSPIFSPEKQLYSGAERLVTQAES